MKYLSFRSEFQGINRFGVVHFPHVRAVPARLTESLAPQKSISIPPSDRLQQSEGAPIFFGVYTCTSIMNYSGDYSKTTCDCLSNYGPDAELFYSKYPGLGKRGRAHFEPKPPPTFSSEAWRFRHLEEGLITAEGSA